MISLNHGLESNEAVYTVINGQSFQDFTKSNRITKMVTGAPATPYFTESVIVPNHGQISLEDEHDGYVEYQNINIAPSKGHLTRNINPEDVDDFVLNLLFSPEGPMMEILEPFVSQPLGYDRLIDVTVNQGR